MSSPRGHFYLPIVEIILSPPASINLSSLNPWCAIFGTIYAKKSSPNYGCFRPWLVIHHRSGTTLGLLQRPIENCLVQLCLRRNKFLKLVTWYLELLAEYSLCLQAMLSHSPLTAAPLMFAKTGLMSGDIYAYKPGIGKDMHIYLGAEFFFVP